MYRRKKKTRVAQKAKRPEEKCATPWCRNKQATQINRGRVATYKVCWKCHTRKLRERRPATYVLNLLRKNAKNRSIDFSLTLAQFTKFCAETGYLEMRGKTPEAYTIDRKNHDEGYHIWNIQIRTHADNSALGHYVPGEPGISGQDSESGAGGYGGSALDETGDAGCGNRSYGGVCPF